MPGVGAEEFAREVWEDESPAVRDPVPPPLRLRRVRVGLPSGGWRTERDSLGDISVPAGHYWGAQTQRSLEHFPIGTERMPLELIHSLARVKQACAMANAEIGGLDAVKARAIVTACREIAQGLLDDEFPLKVFQTGSGTHTNANVNEVLANRANQLLGAEPGARAPVHPSDDVNMSQSTNDTFVTAMHVAAVDALESLVLPSLAYLEGEIGDKAGEWATVPKVGRTHLMDATRLTVGDEWSGYAASLAAAGRHVLATVEDLYEVALGGTAVGTGLNAPTGFAELATAELSAITGRPFRTASNAFSAQSTLDALVRSHAALKSLAVTLYKIVNDLRWMASGPDHGLHELVLPEREAGSTMMPGKVNPTQAEATMMACLRVFGNDVTVGMAGAEGNFELNAFRPVAASAYLDSARVLADAMRCLGRFLVHDLELHATSMDDGVTVVTTLARHIGYDRAAKLAREARAHGVDVLTEAGMSGLDPAMIEETRSELGLPRAS